MNRLLKIPRLLMNGKKIAGALRHQMAGQGVVMENSAHIEAGVKWLMLAQEKGNGGFSRGYCFYRGWDKPYIETTGYIIPTLLAAGRYLKDRDVAEGAKRAAHWLLGMQKENGAFCDTDTGAEQVFDTGQVLTGLTSAFREWGDERLLDAAARAGTWLAEVQEDDGSWERHAYNHVKHAYYVKVAASLLELYRTTGESRHYEAALRNIEWTLGCQKEDGYFRHMEFKGGEYPFLHTIVYVLEGLMDSYDFLGDRKLLEAAMRTVAALKGLNRDRDMLLCSQYGEGWSPVNRERCLVGLAQWAGVAVKAYEYARDEELLRQATKTMYYLKSKQYLRPDPDLHGGLPGSVPLWGKYLGFCYPNWAVKFFIDSLLSYERYAPPLWREQEVWVADSFGFSESVVSEGLGANDRKYIGLIEGEVDTDKDLIVLDVGCGKGKFIQYFREKYPRWTITGVDPSFSGEDGIRTGSAYALPVPDGHVDVALLIEVMQHIDDVGRAVEELRRVTKEGGCIVIGDRAPLSMLGVLKPFMETAGFWMYPWDSPFRERWRSLREWKEILGAGWRITFAQSFDNPDNRIPGSNRFYLLIARKKGP